MIDLNEKELKTIISWYNTADVYYSERGIDIFEEDEELLIKIKYHLSNITN